MVRRSDAVALTIQAPAPDLIALPLSPSLNATARFGLVTIAARTEPPLMDKVRTLMQNILRNSGAPATSTPRNTKKRLK